MKRVYTDTIEEYQALRTATGLIDYQGAGFFTVSGPGAADFVGRVCSRPVDFLLEGQISVALLLREDGSIISEVQLHCQGQDYLIEVWPAQADQARAHLMKLGGSAADATVSDVSAAYRCLGIEGPESFRIAQKFLDFPIPSMAYRSFVVTEHGGDNLLLGRAGVTGEYGYKLVVPAAGGTALRQELIELGARECGFDALDICRMETRFANLERESGDGAATPFDLGLQWMVDPNHEFIGGEALDELRDSATRRPVCWTVDDEGDEVPAAGAVLRVEGEAVGEVTHAVWSPTLRRVIGTARVDRAVAASGLRFSLDGADREIRTVSAPLLVATSFSVSME